MQLPVHMSSSVKGNSPTKHVSRAGPGKAGVLPTSPLNCHAHHGCTSCTGANRHRGAYSSDKIRSMQHCMYSAYAVHLASCPLLSHSHSPHQCQACLDDTNQLLAIALHSRVHATQDLEDECTLCATTNIRVPAYANGIRLRARCVSHPHATGCSTRMCAAADGDGI